MERVGHGGHEHVQHDDDGQGLEHGVQHGPHGLREIMVGKHLVGGYGVVDVAADATATTAAAADYEATAFVVGGRLLDDRVDHHRTGRGRRHAEYAPE